MCLFVIRACDKFCRRHAGNYFPVVAVICWNRDVCVYTLDIKAYTEASRLTRATTSSLSSSFPRRAHLQAAHKRQMLNSFYLRPGFDTSPRPWQFPALRDSRAKNHSLSSAKFVLLSQVIPWRTELTRMRIKFGIFHLCTTHSKCSCICSFIYRYRENKFYLTFR